MLSLKPVVMEYGDNICLRCLDRRLDIHLAHRDVIEAGPNECACCRRTGNVVTGVRLSGHIKMLGKKT